jgi:hypothetical protein
MSKPDETIQKVLDVRKVGVDYEEHQQATPLDIPVDLHNFKKFPVVDPPAPASRRVPTRDGASGAMRARSSPTTADRSSPTSASRTSRTRLS